MLGKKHDSMSNVFSSFVDKHLNNHNLVVQIYNMGYHFIYSSFFN